MGQTVISKEFNNLKVCDPAEMRGESRNIQKLNKFLILGLKHIM